MNRPSNEYLLDRFGKVAGYAAVPYVKANLWLREDLMAAADMAIFVAADRFDWEASEDCYGFAAYLKIIVREECNELLAANAYASSGPRGVLGKNVLHGWGSIAAYEYSQGFEWDDSCDSENVDAIREVAERVLSGRQYEAFARYYFDGICSDTHVAEMLGVQRPAAQKLRVRAEAAIVEELERMELF